MNPKGKEESVEIEVVNVVKIFLYYENEEVINLSIRVLMFISIDLNGLE